MSWLVLRELARRIWVDSKIEQSSGRLGRLRRGPRSGPDPAEDAEMNSMSKRIYYCST